jgi:1,2-dihydroxy-3-keto-5-methylthiopentene dioxygenase
MTVLSVYNDDASGTPEHIRNFDEIAKRLGSVGVLIERWTAGAQLSPHAQSEEVLSAYRQSIDLLNAKYGFKSIDVVSLKPDNPKKDDMRKMFLTEHFHRDFEIRFFVDGRGLFYLHIDGKVYCTLCEKEDLISVPANTTHWFDMGTAPDFKAIRLFTTDNGWVAEFTGSDISTRFPAFDDYLKLVNA